MKKALKIFAIAILTLILLLIAIPFAFHGKIKTVIKHVLNENLNANVTFSDASLSLLNSFPSASITVSDLVITNFEPFKDETLTSIKEISLSMSIKELFKNIEDEPIVINSIYINEALITLKTDSQGNTNYDITKKDNSSAPIKEKAESSSNFTFSIEDYQIKNSAIIYADAITKMTAHLSELNHGGKASFSSDSSELDTNTEVNISFSMDSIDYLSNNRFKLDALIHLDLENNIYSFKENKALINNLPIEFDGAIKLLEKGQDIDITFENPESDFKNFLALIPKAYSKELKDVETTGAFKVKGIIKGTHSEDTIPTIHISMVSDNASFKYANLPKRVENIIFNTIIKNTTGHLDDTYVDIKALNFRIGKDIFKSSALIKNLNKNMLINTNIDGVINLANITAAYPIELETPLTGIFKTKIIASFDREALDTDAYERIKIDGTSSILDFNYASKDLKNPVHISKATVLFNPETITLSQFKAESGSSDFNATGTLENVLGFVLSDNTLKGNFNLNSNHFNVSDFMSEESEVTTGSTKEENSTKVASLKIPTFLDCTINAKVNTVVYDNLNLKDVTGSLIIKDQKAILKNITSTIFNGTLAVSGELSTKEATPNFNFILDAKALDIAKSYKGLELLQKLAPVAKLLQGKLNTSLNLSGNLDETLLPNLNSLSGSALVDLLDTKIKTNENTLFKKIKGGMNFLDFEELTLKDVQTQFAFENGKVNVKPFDIKYRDMNILISGAHNFDETMNYNAAIDVPAKYLGAEINRLIGNINDSDVNKLTIPVTTNIGGNFSNPTVKTDLTSGVSSLKKQLIEIQKQKAIAKGKNEVKNLIGNMLGGKDLKSDSKNQQTNAVKNVIGGILNTKKDSTKTTKDTKTTTKDQVKDVLGGFFKKKK